MFLLNNVPCLYSSTVLENLLASLRLTPSLTSSSSLFVVVSTNFLITLPHCQKSLAHGFQPSLLPCKHPCKRCNQTPAQSPHSSDVLDVLHSVLTTHSNTNPEPCHLPKVLCLLNHSFQHSDIPYSFTVSLARLINKPHYSHSLNYVLTNSSLLSPIHHLTLFSYPILTSLHS